MAIGSLWDLSLNCGPQALTCTRGLMLYISQDSLEDKFTNDCEVLTYLLIGARCLDYSEAAAPLHLRLR